MIEIAIFRFIEILGIQSSRKWGVCSLNDFRKVSYYHFYHYLCMTFDNFAIVLGLERRVGLISSRNYNIFILNV